MDAKGATMTDRPRGRVRARKVTFWTTDAELERLRELARERGESMSGYILEATVYANDHAPKGERGASA